MASTEGSAGVLAARRRRAATGWAGQGVRRFLRGRRVEALSALSGELVLRLQGGEAAVFRAEPDAGCGAALRVGEAPRGGLAAGSSLYPELSGWRIVRVRGGGDQVELHFGDGSTLALCAVVNLDGCRMATVRSRRQRSRASSLLDSGLGHLLQPRPPGWREPKPYAGAGDW